MSLKVGYARVSTAAQDYALQVNALKAAGCDAVFADTASGARRDRPELTKALERVHEHDVLLVYAIDRLGRSLRDLINRVHELGERGVEVRSLTEPWFDTTDPRGTFMFHTFAAFAEMQRTYIRERTLTSIAHRRALGLPLGGRKPKLTPERVELARRLRAEGQPVTAIARLLDVSTDVVYTYTRAR